MRRTILAPLFALVLFALFARPAPAQGVVQAFDGTRGYGGAFQYYLSGNGMVAPRAQLVAGGYTIQDVGSISAAGLAGVDVFVTGTMVPNSVLSNAEASALQAWVAAGGGLLFSGDNNNWTNTNNQFAALFGQTYGGAYAVNGVTLTVTAPAHPVMQGPGGTVTTLSGINTPGSWTNEPAGTTVLATNPDGSSSLLAFGYGSGRVIFLCDTNIVSYPPTYNPDNAAFWDNAIAWLDGGSCTGNVTSYCTAGTTTGNCHATMGSSGTPSLSNAAPFTLTVSGVDGNKNGIVFYSITGRNAAPWGNSQSILCIKSPTQRMNPPANSGGAAGTCNGAYATDWNAYVAANPNKPVNQALLVGSVVGAQSWFRDGGTTGPLGAKGTALSDAIEYVVCP